MPALHAGAYELVCEHETYGRITADLVIEEKAGSLVLEITYDDSK